MRRLVAGAGITGPPGAAIKVIPGPPGANAPHFYWGGAIGSFVLILCILLTILAMLLDAGTTGRSPGQASSRGNMPCASF